MPIAIRYQRLHSFVLRLAFPLPNPKAIAYRDFKPTQISKTGLSAAPLIAKRFQAVCVFSHDEENTFNNEAISCPAGSKCDFKPIRKVCKSILFYVPISLPKYSVTDTRLERTKGVSLNLPLTTADCQLTFESGHDLIQAKKVNSPVPSSAKATLENTDILNPVIIQLLFKNVNPIPSSPQLLLPLVVATPLPECRFPDMSILRDIPILKFPENIRNEPSLELARPVISILPFFIGSSEGNVFLDDVEEMVLSRIDEGIKFIGEIDKGLEWFNRLCDEIGFFVKLLGVRKANRAIWEKYPGVASCFLVLGAIYTYAHGEYWGFVLKKVGIPATPINQRLWGQRFLWYLILYRLPTFDKGVLHYVGRILGHSVIPNDCLPEFFSNLIEPAVRSPSWSGLTAQELVAAWLQGSSTSLGVDRPVWQFLSYGDNVAEKFVHEALKMVRSRYENGFLPEYKDISLPPRVMQCYDLWLHSSSGTKQFTPRSPRLRLDPSWGLQIAFAEQRMPSELAGKFCSWDVTAGATKLRGPMGVAQRRGKEAVFNVPEMAVPPEGPYEIQLMFDDEEKGLWRLQGLTQQKFWKAFSGSNWFELDISRPLQSKPTWFVTPDHATLNFENISDSGQTNPEIQRSALGGEWIGYNAVLIDLPALSKLELSCEGLTEIIAIEQLKGKVSLQGGSLLQNAEISLDHLDLYGRNLPHVVFQGLNCDEDRFTESDFRMRITVYKNRKVSSREFSSGDLKSGITYEADSVSIELNRFMPKKFSPGDISITLWYDGTRWADLNFRWAPDIGWDWEKSGQAVNLHLPDGVKLSRYTQDDTLQTISKKEGTFIINFPENHDEMLVNLSWNKDKGGPYSIDLRLHSPRWAFLRTPTDAPVWQVNPVEIPISEMIEEMGSAILLEVRDLAWEAAEIRAHWMTLSGEKHIVELHPERLPRGGRCLIRLSQLTDTFSRFSYCDSQILMTTGIGCFEGHRDIQVCLMRLISPIQFEWAIQLKDTAKPSWSSGCIEVDGVTLLESSSPRLLVHVKDRETENIEINACWQQISQAQSVCALTSNKVEGRDRWQIDLSQALAKSQMTPDKVSEIFLTSIEKSGKVAEQQKITVMRLRWQTVTPKTVDEWLSWAGKHPLRLLALDLLCDLTHKHWAPLDLLSVDWRATRGLVKRALQVINIECKECPVIEKENSFAMSQGTYMRMYRTLNDIYQNRWGD